MDDRKSGGEERLSATPRSILEKTVCCLVYRQCVESSEVGRRGLGRVSQCDTTDPSH